MNQYLLLRDNKQSGPYSVEELLKKGLKPYDLVWLDGKSAAWRYPSEINELKAFAPAVEEQPYDRFYKKPDMQVVSKPAAIVDQATVQEPAVTLPTHTEAIVVNIPVTPNTTQQVVASKKIYVTLPAGASRKNLAATAVVPPPTDTEIKHETTEQDAIAAALLNEKFTRLRDEKIRQAANKAANPVVSVEGTINDPVAIPAFSTLVEKEHPPTGEQLAPVIRFRPGNNKLVMRSIAAACLLLVGVIIGLVISNSRQQRDGEALDQLVRQIQERDRKNREAVQFALAAANPTTEINNTEEATTTDLPMHADQPPVTKKQATVSARANTRQEATTIESMPLKDVSQRQTVKVIPAMVANKAEEGPAGGQDVEKARKNIHQQVAVDANKYKIGMLGGISELQLTISNNSSFPLDQVEVEVRYFGPEKRVVKTQSLLFNDVAPGEQKTIEAPRTNRGVSVDYVITRINSKALGLAHAGY